MLRRSWHQWSDRDLKNESVRHCLLKTIFDFKYNGLFVGFPFAIGEEKLLLPRKDFVDGIKPGKAQVFSSDQSPNLFGAIGKCCEAILRPS
jgi:hypothetical protein